MSVFSPALYHHTSVSIHLMSLSVFNSHLHFHVLIFYFILNFEASIQFPTSRILSYTLSKPFSISYFHRPYTLSHQSQFILKVFLYIRRIFLIFYFILKPKSISQHHDLIFYFILAFLHFILYHHILVLYSIL